MSPVYTVLVNPHLPCEVCAACLRSETHRCHVGGFLGISHDGAFAEHVVVSAKQVVRIPAGVSFESACYAEPLAATMAVLHASLPATETIAVVGRGRIAELTVMVLREHSFRRVDQWEEAAGNDCCDHLIEAGIVGGDAAPLVTMVRPGGTLVVKSRIPGTIRVPTLELIRKGLNLRAVYYAPFADAVDYLAGQSAKLDRLIGKAWPLEEFAAAFRAARSEDSKVYFAIGD